jgi:hypothetical protein
MLGSTASASIPSITYRETVPTQHENRNESMKYLFTIKGNYMLLAERLLERFSLGIPMPDDMFAREVCVSCDDRSR